MSITRFSCSVLRRVRQRLLIRGAKSYLVALMVNSRYDAAGVCPVCSDVHFKWSLLSGIEGDSVGHLSPEGKL